jgi:hypothetical protein
MTGGYTLTLDQRIAALEAFAQAARSVFRKGWKRRLMLDVGYVNPHGANNYYPASDRRRRVPTEETLREWAVSWNRLHPENLVSL